MQLKPGQVAVVTGAGSGIGLALAERFARAGVSVVLADVEQGALDAATARVAELAETLAVPTDVSRVDSVEALAAATIDRFGGVDVVCNNAGVAPLGDPWFGPLSSWEWVLGVNLWGVVHGCRAFLPHLLARGGGHIVNTASIAGLFPGFSPAYDASKHAVVALSEGLRNTVRMVGLPVGVSVVCPGWVRTNIIDAERNWPSDLGEPPELTPAQAALAPHVRRAVEEGLTPAAVADAVATAVEVGRFWVFPQQEFLDLAVQRWDQIAGRADPVPIETPGMPPRSQIVAEVMAALGQSTPA